MERSLARTGAGVEAPDRCGQHRRVTAKSSPQSLNVCRPVARMGPLLSCGVGKWLWLVEDTRVGLAEQASSRTVQPQRAFTPLVKLSKLRCARRLLTYLSIIGKLPIDDRGTDKR